MKFNRGLAGVGVFGLLVLASCSGGDVEESVVSSVSVSSSSSTVPATPATVGTTTTLEETAVVVSPEEAVLARHQEFMVDYLIRDESQLSDEERARLRDERLEQLSDLAVDPVLARTFEWYAAHEGDGSYAISPGYDSNVIEVQVDGDSAFVRDCSLDRGALYDADGEVLIEADEDHRVRRTVFTNIDGRWFVSEFYTGGDETCDPES